MKKSTICSLAATAALACVFALSACKDNVVYDYEAPAYGGDADVTFNIKAEKTAGDEGKISKSLFGVFLEDINFASYYLSDDLIENGSFEAITKGAETGWSVLSGNTTLSVLSDSDGIFSNTAAYKDKNLNPKYAKISVNASGEGGVRNSGYTAVPFAVQEGIDYEFSAFIKSPDKAFDLKIVMTDGASEYLSGTVPVLQSGEWVKYTRTFKASGTKSNGLQFNLQVPANTEFFIDGVSLKTSDSTLGFKNIPYNAVKDLSPKFIRFPGGCIIEGNYEQGNYCAYDWKNSIGAVQSGDNAGDDVVPAFTYKENKDGSVVDVTTYGEAVTRKPNPNLWAGNAYYDNSYAIGFYEYFLLCESVGASAVPVVNCGLSCMGGVPQAGYKEKALPGRHNQNVADFIRDAIDLIEFAKGGTDTKWGKIRSDLGHPEPFEMDYIGIGNEQWGQYFINYYEKFLEDDAFMKALTDYSIKPIVGNGVAFTDCEQPNAQGKLTGGLAKKAADDYLKATKPNRKIETRSEYGVVDQHYYVSYDTLLTHTGMYDNYIRASEDEEKFYEVFVGEYSANGGVTTSGYGKYVNNEWITALSEAAMMTGYERNGDIIKLAAYAPMFGGARGNNQWGTDMMYFTNTQLVLSANYYVQQLFMKNQGAYRIAADNVQLEWHNDLESTFVLKADEAGKTNDKTVNKLYYVTSLAENGDLIVKVVNVSDETLKTDFAVSDFKFKGNASVTVLQCDDRTAKNSLTEINVEPKEFKIGAFGKNTFGYEIKPYSVISFTVHAK